MVIVFPPTWDSTGRGGRRTHPPQTTPCNVIAGCQNISRACINNRANTYPLSTICYPFFRTRHINQLSETNMMHFLLNLLWIKSLYMFRTLLAHPQEALHSGTWYVVVYWASNARNMLRLLILNKLSKMCIALVSLCWYTVMHGESQYWYTVMHGESQYRYTVMHGQSQYRYTVMHGQSQYRYTVMHGE
jgi:hypothetical protein